jgi:hypothetical protein
MDLDCVYFDCFELDANITPLFTDGCSVIEVFDYYSEPEWIFTFNNEVEEMSSDTIEIEPTIVELVTIPEEIPTPKSMNPFGGFCVICNLSFKSRVRLDSHMNFHTTPLINKCTICFRPFKNNKELIVHFRKHINSNEYPCAHCDKTFKKQHNRDAHARTSHIQEENICLVY